VRERLGFGIDVAPSTAPGAGRGVFLKGSARIGSVVALFPGSVYLREHLRRQDVEKALFPDPHFFLTSRCVGAPGCGEDGWGSCVPLLGAAGSMGW
jgi:hypothetical protein